MDELMRQADELKSSVLRIAPSSTRASLVSLLDLFQKTVADSSSAAGEFKFAIFSYSVSYTREQWERKDHWLHRQYEIIESCSNPFNSGCRKFYLKHGKK